MRSRGARESWRRTCPYVGRRFLDFFTLAETSEHPYAYSVSRHHYSRVDVRTEAVISMSSSFADFMREMEKEARQAGPDAALEAAT